jgi:murein DD-endopeptidase MepM/ murein hydrolase activator NlpD
MHSRFGIVLLSLFLSACATVEQPPLQTAAPISAIPPLTTPGTVHVVQRGETLWRISKTYQVDLDEILRVNNIPDSGTIDVGQRIVIPTEPTAKKLALNDTPDSGGGDFAWPLRGEVVTGFKQKRDGVMNKGIDIRPAGAQDVRASLGGRVTFSGRLPGYGQTVIIDHGNSFSSVYSGADTLLVARDADVASGTAIAKAGDPNGKHQGILHFEIRKRQKPQNPLLYLD